MCSTSSPLWNTRTDPDDWLMAKATALVDLLIPAAAACRDPNPFRRLIPSAREYYRFYGLDAEKLKLAKPDAIVMHPGPMNRGVEIDPAIADGPRSVITHQVEMGVAVRIAVLDALLADPTQVAA